MLQRALSNPEKDDSSLYSLVLGSCPAPDTSEKKFPKSATVSRHGWAYDHKGIRLAAKGDPNNQDGF